MGDGCQLSVTQRLPFSWHRVCLAFWRRYPNPYAKHVVAEDVVDRRIVDGRLHTRRLLVKQRGAGSLPWYLRSIVGMSEYIVEDSVIDPAEQSISTTTRNIGLLSKLGVFTETVLYRPCGDETQIFKTVEVQTSRRAAVSAWATRKATQFFISNYAKRIEDTNRGFLHVLRAMFPPSVSRLKSAGEQLVEKARGNYKAGQELGQRARSYGASLRQRARKQLRLGAAAAAAPAACGCLVCTRAAQLQRV